MQGGSLPPLKRGRDDGRALMEKNTVEDCFASLAMVGAADYNPIYDMRRVRHERAHTEFMAT